MANVIQEVFGQELVLAPIPDGYDTAALATAIESGLPAWIHVRFTTLSGNGDLVIHTEIKLYRAVFSVRFWRAMAAEGVKRIKRFLTVGGR